MTIQKRLRIKDILSKTEHTTDYSTTVRGWVRAFRNDKFIAISDGSCLENIQIVVRNSSILKDKKINYGTSISVKGMVVASPAKGQKVEIQAEEITILGECNPDEYPLQPRKQHTPQFLREQAHLRLRTPEFSSIFRIRHTLSYAIHKFFHDKGFVYFHSPIITASDCEGAGELFQVSAGKGEESFFGKETNLTVSGQLEAELGAMALGQVYTFSPTFRAENSNTTRHLAEFWMIEPEVAFNDIVDNMDLAEELLKYTISYVLDNCKSDIEFLDTDKKLLVDKLKATISESFIRITYSEAVRILLEQKKGKFQYAVSWGIDLQSEHERFLVEEHFKKPVIITDYPKEIKAFYMRQNDDEKTVSAMDILVPGIGEIIGGSQREERLDKLVKRMEEMNIPVDKMQWYIDTRRFGTVPHSGFGLGFERLVQYVTGMTNIRDVIPFPRTPKSVEF